MSTFTVTAHSSTYQKAAGNDNEFILTNRGPRAIQYVFSDTFPTVGTKGHVLQVDGELTRNGQAGTLYVQGLSGDSIVAVTEVDLSEVPSREAALQAGNLYYFEETVIDLAASATFTIYFTTADKPILMSLGRTRKDDGRYTIRVYEDATISDATPTTPTQLNRLSSNVISGTYGVPDSVSDTGTELYAITHLESTVNAGITATADNVVLMKPNSTYLIEYTNDHNMATDISSSYLLIEMDN